MQLCEGVYCIYVHICVTACLYPSSKTTPERLSDHVWAAGDSESCISLEKQ